MELDERYRVLHIDEADSVGEQAVLEFWEREGAISPEAARRRVAEVAFVGLGESEGLVAVSTIFLNHSPRLGMDLWHYRAFIARDHRRGALAIMLTARIKEHFEALFVSGRDRRGGGLIVKIENDILKHVKNEAVWPYVPYVFIGESLQGEHVRVIYFPGALAPAPS